MISATAVAEHQHKLLQFYSQARRYLYERGRLRDATEDELQSLAEGLMYEDFRRHIEPYERVRKKLLSDFYMLQVDPRAQVPKELAECLQQLNDLIESKAREFGYLDIKSRTQPQG